MLPLGIERKMGATLDYVPFAPSDAARTAGRPVARLSFSRLAIVGACANAGAAGSSYSASTLLVSATS